MSSIDQLRKQHDSNQKAIERHRQQLRKLTDENEKLTQRISNLQERERLNRAIGNAGAVFFSRLCGPELGGKPADVLKVNRTRAIAVAQGQSKKWSVPFHYLIDAGGDDLTFIPLGGAE
ncbi:hypothetical protein [Stieleria mannarensis]|uniref:hypothetical protein n=1 Tax=Stieleria mannarensis TaxID=2755585 RepID=UPI0016009B69|nr:hypothetical protein [Rhodopirellula sp. JC639]